MGHREGTEVLDMGKLEIALTAVPKKDNDEFITVMDNEYEKNKKQEIESALKLLRSAFYTLHDYVETYIPERNGIELQIDYGETLFNMICTVNVISCEENAMLKLKDKEGLEIIEKGKKGKIPIIKINKEYLNYETGESYKCFKYNLQNIKLKKN